MGFRQACQAALVASCLLSPVLGGRFTDIRKNQEKRHAQEINKHHLMNQHVKRQENSTDGFKFYNDQSARM